MRRIYQITDAQRAQMAPWRDRWIAIGLSTQRADRPRFERGAIAAYEAASLPTPKRIIWVPSPIVLALAAPIAAYILAQRDGGVDSALDSSVDSALDSSVDSAVGRAVNVAVRLAVRSMAHLKFFP